MGRPCSASGLLEQQQAGSTAWFAGDGVLQHAQGQYKKYGMPRVFEPAELMPVALAGTVPIFVEMGNLAPKPEIIYVLTEGKDCVHQAYSLQQ